MNGEFIGLLLIAVFSLIVSYLIISGTWWVVLWSFDFPIVFAWKQTIGIFLVATFFEGKLTTKTTKETK